MICAIHNNLNDYNKFRLKMKIMKLSRLDFTKPHSHV